MQRIVVDSILSISEPIDGRFGRTIAVTFDTRTAEITEFGHALGYRKPTEEKRLPGLTGLAERIGLRLEEGEWIVMRIG